MNNSTPMQREISLKVSDNLVPPILKNKQKYNSCTDNSIQNQNYVNSNYEIQHPELFRQSSNQDDQQYKSFIQEYNHINQSYDALKKKLSVSNQNEQYSIKVSPFPIFNKDEQNQNQEFEIESVESVQGVIDNKNGFTESVKLVNKKQQAKKAISNIFKNLKKELEVLKCQIKSEKIYYLDIISENIKQLSRINQIKKYKRNQQTQTEKQFIVNEFQQITEQENEETPVPHKQEENFFSVINQYKRTLENNRKIMSQKNKVIFSLQQKQEALKKIKEQLQIQLNKSQQENQLLNIEIKSYLKQYQLSKAKYEAIIKNYEDNEIYTKDSYIKKLESKQTQILNLKKIIQQNNLQLQLIKQNSTSNSQIQSLHLSIKILQQTNTKLSKDLHSWKQEKDQLIQMYEKNINKVTQESYVIYEQNFGLVQKIESFNAELQQKINQAKKQLKRQYRQKIKSLTDEIFSLKEIIKNKQKQISHYQKLLIQNNNKVLALNENIRILSQKKQYFQTYYYENQNNKKQIAESIVSNNSDTPINQQYQFIAINIPPQKKSYYYPKQPLNFKSMPTQQYPNYKNQIEYFKKALNKSTFQKKSTFENKPAFQGHKKVNSNILNYVQHLDYKQIQQKYVLLDKLRQNQLNRISHQVKQPSHSRTTIIKDNLKYSRSNFINNNQIKPSHSRKTTSNKLEYNRIGFQLQNLSQQLKNELLQFGRKKM